MLPPSLSQHTDTNGLYKRITHPAFYPVKSTGDSDLTLQHYTNFIPSDNPDSAWFGHAPTPISIRTYAKGEEMQVKIDKNDIHNPLGQPQYTNTNYRYKEIRYTDEINDVLTELHKNHGGMSPQLLYDTNGRMDPDHGRTILRNDPNHNTNWLYHFQNHFTLTNLQELPGITKDLAYAVKHQGEMNDKYQPVVDTCSRIICPDCNASWKTPYYPGMEHTIDVLSYVAYCPNCPRTNIPKTHISQPEPFTPTYPE